MYKIFIDNIPVHFNEKKSFESNIPERFFPYLQTLYFNDFVKEIKNIHLSDEVFVYFPDLEKQFQLFWRNFRYIEAAGGLVYNPELKKTLYIFRNNYWDVPKGKIENGESPQTAAKREIKEECGINNSVITAQLPPTFHAYFAYNNYWLKKTHWYALTTNQIDVVPQIEEGITQVKWFEKTELKEVRTQTYATIIDVIDSYTEVNQ